MKKAFGEPTKVPYFCNANGESRMYSGPRSADYVRRVVVKAVLLIFLPAVIQFDIVF